MVGRPVAGLCRLPLGKRVAPDARRVVLIRLLFPLMAVEHKGVVARVASRVKDAEADLAVGGGAEDWGHRVFETAHASLQVHLLVRECPGEVARARRVADRRDRAACVAWAAP